MDTILSPLPNGWASRTLEPFGFQRNQPADVPLRGLPMPKPDFELAFEDIQRSNRHRSGTAVRFPCILCWREDKKLAEADRLEMIKEMLF